MNVKVPTDAYYELVPGVDSLWVTVYLRYDGAGPNCIILGDVRKNSVILADGCDYIAREIVEKARELLA